MHTVLVSHIPVTLSTTLPSPSQSSPLRLSQFVLFHDPLRLTRAICVTLCLELPIGVWWAQLWTHN